MNVLQTLLHPFVVRPGNMRSMNMLKERLEAVPPVRRSVRPDHERPPASAAPGRNR